MSIAITINGTVRTTDIEQSIRYSQTLSKSPAKFTFSMNQKAGRVIPTVGQSILVQLNGNNFFKGKITDRSDSMASKGVASYQYTCLDGYFDMDKKLVIKAYSDTTLLAVVTDIVTNFMTGFTLDIPAVTPTINTVRFNYEQPTSCLKKLCDAAGWDWYVDANDVIHVKPATDLVAPYVIDETSGYHIPEALNFDRNINELRNVVFVRGGEYEQAIAEVDAVDKYKSDGTANTFPLVYRYGNTQVTVNGVPVTMGVDFLDDPLLFDCLYNYQEKLVRFPSGTLSSGDIVRVFGNAKVPLIVQAQDDDSVILYGERESVVIDKSIDSISEAELLASSRLEQWREGSKEGSFKSYQDGWKVGQTVTIISPTFGVSDTYKINRVSAQLQGYDTFVYDVEFIKSGQTDFTDLMISLIGKERSNITIADNEVLQKLKRVSDGFGVTDEIYTYFKTTGPYVFTQNQNYYRIKITVDKTKVPADQTGFPVYVDLSAFPREFFDRAKSDGADLRVFKADGTTELPLEIVGYDSVNLKGELYFKGDLSSTVNTDFYVYFGNPAATAYLATDTYGSQNVWMGNGANDFSNLIANPSFETNTTGYTAYVNGGTATAPTLTRDTAEWLSGTASMKHVGSAGTQNYSGASVVVSGLSIGQTYKLVTYTKGTNGHIFNLYAATALNESADITQTGNWLRHSLNFVASATSHTLYLRTPDDAATFYVDSVQVYLASENPTGHRAVYHMNDLTISTVKNSSIGSFDGTKAGGVDVPVEVTGKVGKGQDFNGVSANGRINVVENVIDVSKPFTFRALVRMDSVPDININGILDKFQSNTGANVRGARMTIDTAGKLRFESGYSQTTHTAITSTVWPTAMTIGQYYYVAGVFDGTNLRLHRDTTNQTIATQIPINGSSINFAIGCTHHSNGTLDGVVDEVLIVQSALSVSRLDTESNNLLSPTTFYTIGSVLPIASTPGRFDFATFG